MNFREWLLYSESVVVNFDAWLQSLKRNNPTDQKLQALVVRQPDKEKIINGLQTQYNKQRFFDSAIGLYLSKPNFLPEDLRRLFDAITYSTTRGEKINSYYAAGGWHKDTVQRYEAEVNKIGSGKKLRMKQRGETLPEDEKLYKLIVTEKINDDLYELYDLPPLGYHETPGTRESRHRVLCKLGKGTRWCTASPTGDYHADYAETHIRVIYKNGKPAYQYAVDGSQFMDVEDVDNTMDYNTFLFLNKIGDNTIATRYASTNVYEAVALLSDEEKVKFINNNDLDTIQGKIPRKYIEKFLANSENILPLAVAFLKNKNEFFIYETVARMLSDGDKVKAIKMMNGEFPHDFMHIFFEHAEQNRMDIALAFLENDKISGRPSLRTIDNVLRYTGVPIDLVDKILDEFGKPMFYGLAHVVSMFYMRKVDFFDYVMKRILHLAGIEYTEDQFRHFAVSSFNNPKRNLNYLLKNSNISGMFDVKTPSNWVYGDER